VKGSGSLRKVEQNTSSRLQIRIQNFRLFRDSGWIELDPLTCVVGRNSSGKSSFVFALLLLKQSIEKKVFGSTITPLALSGDYCDLGQFSDLVYEHSKTCKLIYSFRLPFSIPDEGLAYRGTPIVEPATGRSFRPRSDLYFLSLPERARIRKRTVEVSLTFSEDQPYGPSLSRCEMSIGGVGSVTFVRTIRGERRPHWRTYSPEDSVFRALRFQPTTRLFFPQIVPRRKTYRKITSGERSRLFQMLQGGRTFFEYLEGLLRGSEMIGPFRQPPERRYAFAGFGANKIGPSGEQAIDLLITEALIRKDASKPLISAVAYWLRALKLADSFRIKDVAKRLNLFEVDLRQPGGRLRSNLVDVGFGISQVLPVIVQGLLMRRGGIYLVQEPEIHLHPDAQAELADFFLYLACQGVTCIVETHSEYLLLRLRRRLAEARGPLRSVVPRLNGPLKRATEGDVSVLVAQHSGTEATITKLQIGKAFQFENLPPGFMSQATIDRMQLLKAVSKRNG